MRIKCPNSDIYLELPGDRTDMKFTCPACHKIHRVTITISTPGEDSPPVSSNTRSIIQPSPAMPKKYATGAYAPVVDVPIDANFILLDPNDPGRRQGVDLGKAATPPPPPVFDNDFSTRKTEIFENRQPREQSTTPPADADAPALPKADDGLADAEETVRDETPDAEPPQPEKPADAPTEADTASRRAHKPAGGESARRAAAASGRRPTSYRTASSSRRREPQNAGRGLFLLIFLALLAAAGFLGWQQYRYGENMGEADAALARADAAWNRNDAPAAADAALEARAALERNAGVYNPAMLYNYAAKRTGLFAPLADADDDASRRIRSHLERRDAIAAFDRDLDPSNPDALAERFAEAVTAARASGDRPLADLLEKTTVAAALARLDSRAAALEPGQAMELAEEYRQALSAVLGDGGRGLNDELNAFIDSQKERVADGIRGELAGIALDAAAGNTAALNRYLRLRERVADLGDPDLPMLLESGSNDDPAMRQLSLLAGLVEEATSYARTILARSEASEKDIDDIQSRAKEESQPHLAFAEAAASLIDATRVQGDDLIGMRAEIFQRLQNDMRRGRNTPGPRLAWYMLRSGFGDIGMEIDPASIKYDGGRAAMNFRFRGLPVTMAMDENDYEQRVRANMGGFEFVSGWAVLFHKPLTWMADLAEAMRNAGVSPSRHPSWEVMEGPGGPMAVSLPRAVGSDGAMGSRPADAARRVFFNGRLLPVTELPPAGDSRQVVAEFRLAAERLHDGIMADASIPQPLRQALKPVLMGTYQPPDARDYFDSAFCRRLIEANYLETYIRPMPPERQKELDAYRETLNRMEAGYDEFAVDLGDGERLVAVARPDAEFGGDGQASDQDPETGESLPRYVWRWEKGDETVFFSPLPARFVYAFQLADHFPGSHRVPPMGKPALTEVWHATKGLVASYRDGDDRASGNAELWNEAIALDTSGRFDPTMGSPGWNFPLHVLQRDDQGDPLILATLDGIVASPDFTGIEDDEERRRAEDEWLDTTAETLSTPGELGLIFHQFFRYCSDSPLPELPNLIGSHYGLSDTHQTVYESLERRWVGRLIGDCDDLAEFFQVLTRRQGKLSHVMQLPSHAACGYVDRDEDGYTFVVLQTGPVLQFTAPTLNEVVEIAYRSFDRGDGMSHMTTDAVPLLLRFADEETRTPFVLSARIYGDADYAEEMIRVQAYWHEHVYSAAVEAMEKMVAEDQEIGNIKELGSLYERVGFYDKSEEMRRRELDMVKDNPQAAISTLLEIVQLHFQEKNEAKALAALGEMEAIMQGMIRRDDAPEFFRAMTFRSFWAMYLSRLGQPARAWNLIRYDVGATKSQMGRIADPVLRTVVVMYDRLCMRRDSPGGEPLSKDELKAMEDMRRELEEAFGRGYFRNDDSYNAIIGRYFILGRYAVSDLGREEGLAKLLEDGPYPDSPKDHTRRTRGVDEEDWKWIRIAPQIYLTSGLEMLDKDEYPELYDPEGAKPLLEDVARAVEKGAGLGSDVAGGDDVVKAEMALAFINRDLDAFRRSMAVVKEKDYASLYDDAALTFGLHCGLVPLAEFPAWVDAFHDFFPGSQHYFKVVYRAVDKENYDHALVMAEATVRFFPDMELLAKELEFVRGIIPGLKERKAERERRKAAEAAGATEVLTPAA